jgi:hypothetical protein
MAAHPHRRNDINMTIHERRSYVRWWIESSGLTPDQIREVATGIWSDRVDATAGSLTESSPLWSGAPASQHTTAALPGLLFRSAAGPEASDVAGES